MVLSAKASFTTVISVFSSETSLTALWSSLAKSAAISVSISIVSVVTALTESTSVSITLARSSVLGVSLSYRSSLTIIISVSAESALAALWSSLAKSASVSISVPAIIVAAFALTEITVALAISLTLLAVVSVLLCSWSLGFCPWSFCFRCSLNRFCRLCLQCTYRCALWCCLSFWCFCLWCFCLRSFSLRCTYRLRCFCLRSFWLRCCLYRCLCFRCRLCLCCRTCALWTWLSLSSWFLSVLPAVTCILCMIYADNIFFFFGASAPSPSFFTDTFCSSVLGVSNVIPFSFPVSITFFTLFLFSLFCLFLSLAGSCEFITICHSPFTSTSQDTLSQVFRSSYYQKSFPGNI